VALRALVSIAIGLALARPALADGEDVFDLIDDPSIASADAILEGGAQNPIAIATAFCVAVHTSERYRATYSPIGRDEPALQQLRADADASRDAVEGCLRTIADAPPEVRRFEPDYRRLGDALARLDGAIEAELVAASVGARSVCDRGFEGEVPDAPSGYVADPASEPADRAAPPGDEAETEVPEPASDPATPSELPEPPADPCEAFRTALAATRDLVPTDDESVRALARSMNVPPQTRWEPDTATPAVIFATAGLLTAAGGAYLLLDADETSDPLVFATAAGAMIFFPGFWSTFLLAEPDLGLAIAATIATGVALAAGGVLLAVDVPLGAGLLAGAGAGVIPLLIGWIGTANREAYYEDLDPFARGD
jgi:hypothetical protein